eukprot:4733907-Pleurochrysis_carterae.AAC.1
MAPRARETMCVCAFVARARPPPPFRLVRALPGLRACVCPGACPRIRSSAHVQPSPTRARVRALTRARARPRCVRLLSPVTL